MSRNGRSVRMGGALLASCLTLTSALAVAQRHAPVRAELATDSASLRARFLANARRYASFEWTASERNVMHGEDANGTRVDTPDASFDPDGWHADGRVNRGMPYAWGGFTSIEEFRAGLERGLAAGLVPQTEHASGSRQAMGLDCSGFVARAWDLPVKQSTRTLGGLCYRLETYAELEPGDVMNRFDSHVVLFAGWADTERTRARVYEAARLRVKESEYPLEALERSGFLPMRYKPLDARWVPMELGAPELGAPEAGRFVAEGEPAEVALADLPSPLADARAGEWARYAVTDDSGRMGTACARTTMVARVDERRVEVQSAIELLGDALYTGADCDAAASLALALIEFVSYEEPLGEMTAVEATVESGAYALAGRELAAERVVARLEGSTVVRHRSYPVELRVSCVLSPEVPLHGVLEAEFDQTIVWGEDEGGEPIRGRRRLGFALREYGTG